MWKTGHSVKHISGSQGLRIKKEDDKKADKDKYK